LLALHFKQIGIFSLFIIFLLLPLLLFIKYFWVMRFFQIILFLGAIEWIRTAIVHFIRRISDGEPWFLFVLVVMFIAIYTGGSALIFSFSKTLRKRYRNRK